MLNGEEFNEEQLSMFVPAHEIYEHYKPGDVMVHRDETVNEMWDRKRSELDLNTARRDSSFLSSIGQHGVREPVWAGVSATGQKHLWEGHHRIAAQHTVDPDRLVPVIYGHHDPNFGARGREIDRMLKYYRPRD